MVDLEHGGQAAQIVVIPRYTFNTPGSKALNERLKGDAGGLAAATGTTTGVTRQRRRTDRLHERDLANGSRS